MAQSFTIQIQVNKISIKKKEYKSESQILNPCCNLISVIASNYLQNAVLKTVK